MDTLALRIEHKPMEVRDEPSPTGHVSIERGESRAVLLTPTEIDPAKRYPLITVLHGAGRQDEMLVKACRDEPEKRDALFLVPRSLLPTWDLIASPERPDLDFLEYAYDLIYRRYPVDAGRQALLGYSDGASYALSVGLSNPHLFRAVMGWAAGFIALDRTFNLDADPQAARAARVRHARRALPVRARGGADAREPAQGRLHRRVSRRPGRQALAVAGLPARGARLVLLGALGSSGAELRSKTTRPRAITRIGRKSAERSSSGLPSTTSTSAAKPARSSPVTPSRPSARAHSEVAARSASTGRMPASRANSASASGRRWCATPGMPASVEAMNGTPARRSAV